VKTKFEFYEIVKINTKDPARSIKNDYIGYIAGKSTGDNTIEYAVCLFDDDMVYCFNEMDLESTGQFFEEENLAPRTKIRVQVNDDEGEIKQTFKNYHEIESAIDSKDIAKVSGYMLEVGFIADSNNETYTLIEKCIDNADKEIQLSGLIALRNLLIRTYRSFDNRYLDKILQKASRFNSDDCVTVVKQIIDLKEEFFN
jgi:uncharacterized protein YutE (UPF0331/DUF86 family)